MQIKSLLEMTLTKNIAQIAKEHLTIGEKPLREALKLIGCEQNKGKRGWFYNGSEDVLEKSIYDFVTPSKKVIKTKGNNTNSDASNSKRQGNNIVNNASENVVPSEIQSLLKVKSKVDRLYKGIYFDTDIANFLDNVPNGNKSDIVNKIMRAYLKDNGFL